MYILYLENVYIPAVGIDSLKVPSSDTSIMAVR